MASRYGKPKIVCTLVEFGAEKEAKDGVRNLMMMMMTISVVTTIMMIMIVVDDVDDDDDEGLMCR